MKDNYFLKKIYNGSDGIDFKVDFVCYLKDLLNNTNFTAISDHQLFLQGGKQAITEIIEELEK